MKEQTISFSRVTRFTGRNGTFNCAGLRTYVLGDDVTIQAIANRGKEPARCEVEVPVADAAKLSKILGVYARENTPFDMRDRVSTVLFALTNELSIDQIINGLGMRDDPAAMFMSMTVKAAVDNLDSVLSQVRVLLDAEEPA